MGGDQEESAATVSEVIEHFENICCVQVHHGVATEVKYFHHTIIFNSYQRIKSKVSLILSDTMSFCYKKEMIISDCKDYLTLNDHVSLLNFSL